MLPFFFGNIPFKGKRFLLISSVTAVALLFFLVLSVLNYIYTLKEVMFETMDTVSKSIAEQSIPELSFRGRSEPDMALLAIFRNDPDIEGAIIYDTDNGAFLTYLNPENTAPLVLPDSLSTVGERFIIQNGKLKFQVVYPITFKGKDLGTVYILSNTNKLINHFWNFLFLMVLSFILSLGVALFAASRLQKRSSQTINLLASSARKIVEQGDYSLRLASSAEDEIGDLVTSFNLVLEDLQPRDEQLQKGQQELETLARQRIEKMLVKFLDALAGVEEKIVVLAERHKSLSPVADTHAGNVRSSYSSTRPEDVLLLGKVLLVDDEPINRTVLATVLQKIGLEVEVAQNGIEALQMIMAKDFSLVLMDIHMPEMSGFEATKMIRTFEKRSGRRRVMILAMTADGGETTRQECVEVGMDSFFTKPIKPEVLIERIAILLGADKLNKNVASTLAEQEIAQNTPEQGLWSRAQAVAFVGGDEALFSELATVFLGRNDLLLQNIEAAIEHGDADDLLETAHAYKGAIGHFACPTLRRSAMALENQARTGRIEGADVHLTDLRDNSRLLCSDLSQLVIEAESS